MSDVYRDALEYVLSQRIYLPKPKAIGDKELVDTAIAKYVIEADRRGPTSRICYMLPSQLMQSAQIEDFSTKDELLG